jgi:hypothetical protein
MLIEHGADVNFPVRQRDGMVTPLGIAIRAKQPKMETLLKEHGARATA